MYDNKKVRILSMLSFYLRSHYACPDFRRQTVLH